MFFPCMFADKVDIKKNGSFAKSTAVIYFINRVYTHNKLGPNDYLILISIFANCGPNSTCLVPKSMYLNCKTLW